ncbi:hypothetical protein [Vibrio furnissii]|uniref:hypothetical protein n=1 Tax=Vibrio furnissii TaxID=29494 RepID=UPI0015593975|nr:hypothetical protein [Vibrio furnissii]
MGELDLIIDYTEADFAQAIRTLLPKGEYWQEEDNPALTAVIQGMATDFKLTHDEIQLSLLTEFREHLFGWKLRDYQALMDDTAGEHSGVVSDSVLTPNLIDVTLYPSHRQYSWQVWAAFESERLPHTNFTWTYQSIITVVHHIASYRHIRNQHCYEVVQ